MGLARHMAKNQQPTTTDKGDTMKIIPYLLLIIILAVFASAESLEIKLIQYDPESTHARIQIRNIETTPFRNITLRIDSSEPVFLIGILSPNNAVVNSRNVQSGLHNVTVRTKEGITVTKEILFTKSFQEVQKEVEIRKSNETKINTTASQSSSAGISTKKKSNLGKIIFFILLLLFIFAAITYWYLNTRPKQQKPVQQAYAMPPPIMQRPPQIRTKSPGQIRKEMEEHAKRRRQMLEGMIRK